jgi:tRNA (guanine-N7-)-methyltransferase
MPHLHVTQFHDISLPASAGDISFEFLAQNILHKDEQLVAVTIGDQKFFLLCQKNQDKYLLKSDKLTRPTSTHLLHRALLDFAEFADLEVIASNVPRKEENEHLKNISALKNIEFFTTLLPLEKKVSIEIGFGSGRHLLYQAQNNPDKIYIGIEIHKASIEQVIKQININGLDNIYLLNYDARLFLELIPSNCIEKIYVHFPVPWDKKPHRRVISPAFIDEAYRVLEVSGKLELRTDSENYYDFAYRSFIARPKSILDIKKNQDINITSKYEARWQRMQKNIYDIIMTKDEIAPPLQIEGSFDFKDVALSSDISTRLHNKSVKFDGGFVHVERTYAIQNTQAMLFRISMGSFDRPEHLYIIVDGSDVRYFPKPPIRSKSNLKAHHILNELLHE